MARKLDGAYSWLIAVACCCLFVTSFGFQRPAGVLYVEIMQAFNIKREDAAWPFCVCGAVSSFTGVVGGSMVHFFSPRQVIFAGVLLCAGSLFACSFANTVSTLTVAYGVFFGLGISAISPIIPVILNQYFRKYRSTANGIALAGGSISLFVLPPMIEYFLEVYTLRGTFLLLSAVTLQTLVAASLLRNRLVYKQSSDNNMKTTTKTQTENNDSLIQTVVHLKPEAEHHDDQMSKLMSGQRREMSVGKEECQEIVCDNSRFSIQAFIRVFVILKELLIDPMFTIITLSSVVTIYNIVTVGVIIVDYGIDRGLQRDNAVLLMPVIAFPELFGRLLFGLVADNPRFQRKHLILIVEVLLGAILFLLAFSEGRITLFILTGSFGLVSASALVMVNVLYYDYFGPEKLGIALGMKMSLAGFVFLLSPTIIGIFRDEVGSYNYLFYLMGGAAIVCGIAWFLEPLARNKAKDIE